MTLRTPKIKELKTELISVMDYFPPAQPHSDSGGNIVRARDATTQSDEVRKAMVANMFVQLMEIIGNRTPSDIETSALILKEIDNLISEYEASIAPLLNLLEGPGALLPVVRQEVADITRNSFSGIDIPTNILETPSNLVYTILSPFHGSARIQSILETAAPGESNEIRNLSEKIWGDLDEIFSETNKPNFITDTDTGSNEFFQPFKYISLFGDYLAQAKAIAQVFPQAYSIADKSPHSYVVKKSIKSDEIGILKPIMFDFTTSNAKSATTRSGITSTNVTTLVPRFVVTDPGYERAFKQVQGVRNSLSDGTTNKEQLSDWLNKPQNVLNPEAVASLRDGFLSDTELAEELGLESSNLDPLQSESYLGYVNSVRAERSDLIQTIRNIIVNSDFSSGLPGDFVPGVSPQSSVQGGDAFRNCSYIGIKEGLGNALTHQNCISLAGLFAYDLETVSNRFFGADRVFGRQWHQDSIREICKYIVGILTGRTVPNGLNINPITGEVVAVENADPNYQANLNRIDQITRSIDTLNRERTALLWTRASILRGSDAVTKVNRFIGPPTLVDPSDLHISRMSLIPSSARLPDGRSPEAVYSDYIVELTEGLIATGHAGVSSIRKEFSGGSPGAWIFRCTMSKGGGQFIVGISYVQVTSYLDESIRERIRQFLSSEVLRVSAELLTRLTDTNARIDDIQSQIQELEAELETVRIENVEFIVNSTINNFPFSDTLTLGDGISSIENVQRILQSSQYTSFVGFTDISAAKINDVDLLNPTINTRSDDTEALVQSGFISANNSVILQLIQDCVGRIQSISATLSNVDITNYAYAYFMLAGAIAREGVVVDVDRNLTEEVQDFSNKILSPRRTISIFAKTPEDIISVGQLNPSFQRNYSNAIGLGGAAPSGQIADPYQNSLDYVQSISDLITQTLAPGFSVASEALLLRVNSLRRAFARSIAIGGSNTEIPINILDVLVGASDFREFANKIRIFLNQKSLTPVLLLSTNDVLSSFSLLQYSIYALTQSPLTKLDTFSIGSSEVPYNKVCSIGINKNLEDLIDDILPTADVERIKRDFVKLQILERQLDPSPSGLDTLLSNTDEYLEYGSRYLQSTPSPGQPGGGFNYYLGLEQDYKFIAENFSISNPVVKVSKNITNPVVPRREFAVNLASGRITERFSEATSGESGVETEVRDSIVTFIRSEALKIYYYYMTGLIFEPEFAPDPDEDDSLITQDLISSNPITRLKALLDLCVASRINIFKNIVLIPFISDNDSIEEFSAKIRFLT